MDVEVLAGLPGELPVELPIRLAAEQSLGWRK